MELKEMFDKHSDEYREFYRIENPLSSRPDLAAFLLLDKLVPGANDMVSFARYDEITLCIDTDVLCECLSEEDCITLIRCGVRYSVEYDCLDMFV